MKEISVLGAGLVGGFIAKELAKNHNVTVFDIQTKNSHKSVQIDLSKKENIKNAIRNADLVINALPGKFGFKALKVVIENKKNVVDISFMPEDMQSLDELAKKNKVTAIVDFGFAPGLCHMIVGADNIKFNREIKSSVIYVGGLPEDEEDEYKAVFSPRDIVEEYTRPARFKVDGNIKIEHPFEKIYTTPNEHPAFISDGLRSLLNYPIDNIVEYTARYPKHFEKMQYLKEDGFFNPENVEQTAKVLGKKWKWKKDDRDISYLEVLSTSKTGETSQTVMYDLHDGENHSMARMTGLPAIFAANCILDGMAYKPGVNVPEILGENKRFFDAMMEFLIDNGVEIYNG